MSDAIQRLIERHGAEAICRVMEPMLTPERIARIDTVLAARLQSVVTIVEDTYDPHNAAATIRTTEAIRLQELHVVERAHRFAAAQGVTRGAHKWIDLHRWTQPEDVVNALHARGFRVYATLPSATSEIDDVDVSSPTAVMFGNEHAGLTAEAVAACDGSVGVSMQGFTESFNLSVTVAIAMRTIAQRRRRLIGTTGDLDEARRRDLRARWFALKIRGAVEILSRALS